MIVRLFVVGLLLSPALHVHAQSYVGLRFDNYAGVQGLTFNPASVVNPHLRGEINLASASAFLGNDYVSIGVSDVLEISDNFDFLDGEYVTASNENYVATNVDILGPSVLFATGKKSGLALMTRVRTMANVDNVNGELLREVEQSFQGETDFAFSFDNQRVTGHGWGEVALVYGREVAAWEGGVVRAAVTAKYLKGAGAAYITGRRLAGEYNAGLQTLTAEGDVSYGYTSGFEDGEFSTESLGSGFGFDLGLLYEWQPTGEKFTRKRYKLKLGVSLTDLGSISYSDARLNSYVLSGTADVKNYEEQGLEDFLIENYEGRSDVEERAYRLPTALRLMADLSLTRNLFVTVASTRSLTKDEPFATAVRNTLVVAPRLESKWLSVYSPLTFGDGDSFRWGLGLRLGLLTVGSGSALSALLQDDTQAVDLYAGLKIPFYRKGIARQSKEEDREGEAEDADQSEAETEDKKDRRRR